MKKINDVSYELELDEHPMEPQACYVARDLNINYEFFSQFRQRCRREIEFRAQAHTYKYSIIKDYGRFVHYLGFEQNSIQQLTYLSVWKSSEELTEHLLINIILMIAMAKFGAGNGRLGLKFMRNRMEV